MCGIAGVVAWHDKFRTSRETLAKMSAAIAHRGPDGEGVYFNHEDEITPDRPQCALAHRRLAIIDPDPRSNEPFPNSDGTKWLVFNGEIYNYRELRAELTRLRPDYQWRTAGDTEVLMVAYETWWKKCVTHLNGMFAFAVWDARDGALYLARDRMGQKPLYYALVTRFEDGTQRPSAVAFASELNALVQLPWCNRSCDSLALAEYLRWGYVPEPRSIYAETLKLWPASWIHIGSDGVRYVGYFDRAQPEGSQQHPPDAAITTRRLVIDAVSRQLVADVPVGCFLSGGTDSSIIAASMRNVLSRADQLHTFSIGFEDARYDEREYARRISRHLGSVHTEFLVRSDAMADLPRLALVFGEPFADSSALPTHYLSERVREHVKVALSGDGGDELFCGYDRYRAMRLGAKLAVIPKTVRDKLLPHLSRYSVHPKSTSSRVSRLLGSLDMPPAQRYASYLENFTTSLITELGAGSPEKWKGPNEPVTPEFSFHELENELDLVRCAMATDRMNYLPDDLLTKLDRASMLHNLEVRSPFMDHELVQFAAGLTTDQLLKGGPKRMLREAFAQDLPAWVFKRKKMGFAVPIGDWFRSSLKEMLHDNLFASDSFGARHFNMPVVRRLFDEHQEQRVDHSQRLYALLMLELWWRTSRRL